jgi:hypothetical protein
MDERLRFVARLLEGEKMSTVCRQFGISRKTGYKLFNRYREEGLQGLDDRPRSPYRHPNQLPFQVETAILMIKQDHPTWGAHCLDSDTSHYLLTPLIACLALSCPFLTDSNFLLQLLIFYIFCNYRLQ